MRTMCSREIFKKKSRQQQNFDSDLKGAWHYNHVTFTPISKIFLLYCTLIYMLSILCVNLTIKAKVGIPESFKVGWYRQKITGSSHLLKILINVCFPASSMTCLTFYLKIKLALKYILEGANETGGKGGLKVVLFLSPQ